jgi:hypothetical protein
LCKGFTGCDGINARDDFIYIEAFLGIWFDHARNKVKYIVAVRMLTRNLILPCENCNHIFVLKTVINEEEPV